MKLLTKTLAMVCVVLMTATAFQAVFACGGGAGDGGMQEDIFIDHFGYKHKVWRQDVNGTYQVFYSDNIDNKHHGYKPSEIQVTHSLIDVLYPQISIDPVSNITYVLWITDHANTSAIWYAGSVDFANWSQGWYGGNATLSHGNPDLDMRAYNYDLNVTWKHHGTMTIKPDLDGDLIPDSKDSAPLKYDSGMGNYFIEDAVGVNTTVGISVAIDYKGNSTTSPTIVKIMPTVPLAGCVAPYVNVTLSTVLNYSALIRFKYDRDSLPPFVNENYLRIYVYDTKWQVINDISGRKGGVDIDREYVWALLNHLCTITIADASSTDLNGNGIPDIWDTNAQTSPERLTIFSGDSLYPKTYINPSNVLHIVWVDNRDGLSAVYYKRSNDDGQTWTTDTAISDQYLGIPYLSFSGYEDRLAVAYVETWDNDGYLNTRIHMLGSLDGGLSWQELPIPGLSNGINPDICLYDDHIYMVYDRKLPSGPFPQYYILQGLCLVWSNDGMVTGGEMLLPTDSQPLLVPKIAVCGDNIYIVWAGYFTDGQNYLHYMESHDMGQTWNSYYILTDYHGENDPGAISFKAKSDKLYLVWSDNRDGQFELYYKEKTTGAWSADLRLTTSDTDSKYPDLALDSSSARHIVWQEVAGGIPETYYMKLLETMTPTEDFSIGEIPISGTVQGTYQDTQSSDDSYETITETPATSLFTKANSESTISGIITGDYTKTFSIDNAYEILQTDQTTTNHYELKHQWTFIVSKGVVHRIYIYGYPSSTTNQQFQFSYAINSGDFIPFYLTTPSNTDLGTSYDLPSDTEGTVIIQIENTIKTVPGTYSLDWTEIMTVSYELEHKWIMGLSSATEYIFKVEAHLAPNTWGDQYTFSYSTDDTTYINMFTVTDTVDTLYSYTLPNQLPSTIYLRVIDTVTNWYTPDNSDLGILYIDSSYILTNDLIPNIVTPPTLISDNDGISSARPSIALDSYDNYYIYWNDLLDGNWELNSKTDLTSSDISIDPIISTINHLPDVSFSTESSATPESQINTAELYRNTLTSKLETLSFLITASDNDAAYKRIQGDILPGINSMIVEETVKGGISDSITSIGGIVKPLTGTPPNDPENLWVISNGGWSGALTIGWDTWDANTGGPIPDGYQLYRSVNRALTSQSEWSSNGIAVSNSNQPNVNENGLTDELPYYYAVRAYKYYGAPLWQNVWSNYVFTINTVSPPNNLAFAKPYGPPYVSSTNPSNNAVGISIATSIQITFHEAMNVGTVSYTISPSASSTYSWSGNTLSIFPSGLNWQTTYTIKIPNNAAALTSDNDPTTYDVTLDSSNNARGDGTAVDDFYLHFTTESNTNAPPAVGCAYPRGNQVDYQVPQPITIFFTKAMYPSAQNAFLLLPHYSNTPVTGTFNWPNAKTLVFTPSDLLTEGTRYTVVILASATSSENGATLGSDWSYQFWTILSKVEIHITTTSTTFYLSWDWMSTHSNPSTIYPYEIYMSDSLYGTYSLVGTTMSNSYAIPTTGMQPYTLYFFKIKAYNDMNCWSLSDGKSVENRNLNYYLDVGNAGDQDINILSGFRHLGITLYPEAGTDGWSNPIDPNSALSYRMPAITNEGEPYVPADMVGQKFLLNIPPSSPDLHVDFLITMHYNASGAAVLQQCIGRNIGTRELIWADIGTVSGHLRWETAKLTTDHKTKPYYDFASWTGENDINVLFRFKDPSCVYLDWIKFEPLTYFTDIGINDNNVMQHSPGICLYPDNMWNPLLETDGSRYGQASSCFYVNVPDLDIPSFRIEITYKTSVGNGKVQQYDGSIYNDIGTLIGDMQWHTQKFNINCKKYSDYSVSDSDPFYNELFKINVPIYVLNLKLYNISENDHWTVMVYIPAESDAEGPLIDEFQELEAANTNGKADITALFDRDFTDWEGIWHNMIRDGPTHGNWPFTNDNSDGVGDWGDHTRRFHVKHDTDQYSFANYQSNVDAWDMGELNMGDPTTLSDFISWSKSQYPADHYILILADHAGGWHGFGKDFDQPSSSDYALSINSIKTALSTANIKFDILGFDACLMGSIEVAYEFKDYTYYYVAGEQASAVSGWAFTPAINSIAEPFTSPNDVAQRIAFSFVESNNNPSYQYYNQVVHSDNTVCGVICTKYLTGFSQIISLLGGNLLSLLPSLRTQIETVAYTVNNNEIHNEGIIPLMDKIIQNIPNDLIRNLATQVKLYYYQNILVYFYYTSVPSYYGMTIFEPGLFQSHNTIHNDILSYTGFDWPRDTQWDEYITGLWKPYVT